MTSGRCRISLSKYRWRAAAGAVAALLPFAVLAQAQCDDRQPPPEALAVGYSQSTWTAALDQVALTPQEVRPEDPAWFLTPFFGLPPGERGHLAANGKGGVSFDGANLTLGTAAPLERGGAWRGTAFGGGGYFSVVLKVEPRNGPARSTGWPAFWAMAVEHLAEDGGAQWRGMPAGYEHFIETDIFEDDVGPAGTGTNRYGATAHEWYGKYQTSCAPEQYCEVSNAYGGKTRYDNNVVVLPSGSALGDDHEYGLLWVPATDDRDGFAQFFFDGRPNSARISWAKFRDETPPPGSAPWSFGIIDYQHLVLFLGTGGGSPMTVRCVKAWQASAQYNWVR